MNAITFQLKRGHLAASKAGRWLLKVVPDMTPARFDIMLLLRRRGFANARVKKWRNVLLNHCFTDQSLIVRELGLHKSTVSEALGRLAELGWVERYRDFEDRRNQLVQMTRLGLARLAEACRILFRRRVVRRAVDRIVRHLQPDRPFKEAFDSVWTTISQLARFFGDTSMFDGYDRQIGYELPEFTAWERFTNRLYGPDAGPRLPDFVIEFLYHWEQPRLLRAQRPGWD